MDLFDWIDKHSVNGQLSKSQKDRCWDLYGKKKAVLVMDSSGFSSKTQDFGILHFLSNLNEIRKLVVPIFHQFNGEDIRCEADNFFVSFQTVDSAFLATRAVLDAVSIRNQSVSKQNVFFLCAGIGYGSLLQTDREGCYGHEMNLASKLGEDLADSNEILLTEAAYKLIDTDFKSIFHYSSTDISTIRLNYWHTLYHTFDSV